MSLPGPPARPLDLDLSRVGLALVNHLRASLPAELRDTPVELVPAGEGPPDSPAGVEIRVLGIKVAPQFKNPYASLPGQAPGPASRLALELHLHVHPRCRDPLLQLRLLGWLLQTALERPLLTITGPGGPDAPATPADHVQITVLDEASFAPPPGWQPGILLNLRSAHGSFALHASPDLPAGPRPSPPPTPPKSRPG